MAEGGVCAIATLRGGGEFGEEWHRAGMLENKKNVFDDFISAAEWLVDNGYTRPDHLAIHGGSNGGLLMGAAITQRVDLFRAALVGVPDLDMVRFVEFAQNNNKPALLEYGDASIPEQFEFVRRYSPYQNVRDGERYPAVIFQTGDLDTRVPPLQARKMAAIRSARRGWRSRQWRRRGERGRAGRRFWTASGDTWRRRGRPGSSPGGDRDRTGTPPARRQAVTRRASSGAKPR